MSLDLDHASSPCPAVPPIRDALSPFDDADADIILRSSDNVDFRAHKLFLTKASPFFKDLFSLPPPDTTSNHTDESKGGLAVVPLSEDERAIDTMLRFCYPRSCCPAEPVLDNAEAMTVALQLASKYQLPVAEHAVILRLRAEAVVAQPARVWAAAWALGLRDVVMAAARHTLRVPPADGIEHDEYDHIPATALVRLSNYRKRCIDVARNVTSDLSWMNGQSDTDPFPTNCTAGGCGGRWITLVDGGTTSIKTWWWDYFQDTFSELEKAPSEWTPVTPGLVASAIAKAAWCPVCRANGVVAKVISHSSRRLFEELGRRLSEVELKTPF